MFSPFSKKKPVEKLLDEAMSRELEEELYGQVLREIEQGERRDGLWAKALVAANGDESIAKAQYIRLRVQALFDDGLIGAFKSAERAVAQEELEKEREKERKAAELKASAQKVSREFFEARELEARRKSQQFEANKLDVNSDTFWTYATTDQLISEFSKLGARLEKLSGGWSIAVKEGDTHKVATRPSLQKLYKSISG